MTWRPHSFPPLSVPGAGVLLAGILAAGVLATCAGPEPTPGGPPPPPLHGRDLILVTVDTLRADAVGAYGAEVDAGGTSPTPTIDALASRGRVFTQAVAPMPRTTPSLASLLTGRSPKHHGSREVGQALFNHVPLLSQVLQGQGYRTVGVTANRAAAAPQGLDRGFDVFRLVPGDKPAGTEVTRTALDALDTLQAGDAPKLDDSAATADRPLFLWVHYVDPHFPYLADQAERDACTAAIEVYGEHAAFVFGDQDGVSSRALEDCRRRYLAEVSRTDREIERLLEGLSRRGHPPEEALVVFTSDHGENLGEGGLFFEHGPSLHDAGLRVPLVVAGPGLAPGRSAALVELQDLAPTLLTLLGVPPERHPPMDGRDLSGAWLSEANATPDEALAFAESNSSLHIRSWDAVVAGRAERHCVHRGRWSLCGEGDDVASFRLFDHEADPMLENDVTDEHPDLAEELRRQRQAWPPETARTRAVRGTRFKLVETPRPEGGYERRLFDLRDDPAESRDVSAEFPEVAERLGRALDAHVADLPPPGQVVRDDAELEALRALGYVE